jgi:hypothetical protein
MTSFLVDTNSQEENMVQEGCKKQTGITGTNLTGYGELILKPVPKNYQRSASVLRFLCNWAGTCYPAANSVCHFFFNHVYMRRNIFVFVFCLSFLFIFIVLDFIYLMKF